MTSRKKVAKQASPSQIRIIGGQWRSRKLDFPIIEGLRPTPDRVRETLFNWLQTAVPAASCLDLFAGSGALGLEALSRGAKDCTFVDIASLSCQTLKANVSKLDCQQAKIVQSDALSWLKQIPEGSAQFDIVFLDPPFNKDLCQQICTLLSDKKLLASGAFVYVETEPQAVVTLPWRLHREKVSGQVRYRLFQS